MWNWKIALLFSKRQAGSGTGECGKKQNGCMRYRLSQEANLILI